MEEEAKNKKQDEDEIINTLKGPSFTLMYLLFIALIVATSFALYSIIHISAFERRYQQDISKIQSALACIEDLPNKLKSIQGEKFDLNLTIEYPKTLTNLEDHLGEIIPIIQEQNAQAYDNLSNNLTLFSILIALIALALPIFSYAFIQKDQMRRIDTQHLLLNKKVDKKTTELVDGYTKINSAATQKIADLDTKFTALNEIIDSKMEELNKKQTKLEKKYGNAIDDIKKQIEQTQEVTSSVIPSSKGDDAVEITPTSKSPADTARALFLGARINLSNENYDEALKQINQAIKLEENNAEYHNVKSSILHKMDNYIEALTSINTALKLNSDNARYYNSRSKNLFSLHRYNEALKDANEMIRLEPDNARNYIARSSILARLKRYQEALADNEQTVLLDPENMSYKANRAYRLYQIGFYARALESSSEMGDFANRFYTSLRARAMASLKLVLQEGKSIDEEQRKMVIDCLQKAVAIDPNNRFSYIDQAQAYLLLHEYDSMFESLQKATAIDQDEPETYHWLAEYYRAIGDTENAAINDNLANEKGYIPEPEE